MRKNRRIWLLVFAHVTCTFLLLSQPSTGYVTRTFVLWNTNITGSDSLDQQAFEKTLQCMGFHPARLDPSRLSATPLDSNILLVVPRAAANTCAAADVDRILRELQNGLSLITDGKSPLSNALRIRLGAPARVSQIRDRLRPEIHPFWSDGPVVPWVAAAPKPAPKVLYTDKATGHPLAILMQVGKGLCIYLAPLFDPRTGRGYGRFATLPDAIVKLLGRRPPLSRQAADAYFDAGYRTGQPPDSLAKAWRRWGIRTIHAAAWYAYDDPPYDYRALIEACHQHGILVYAWLEWPYIGRGFWDSHPEWRQKNALLKDAHFDFLYLMDLQNPACMKYALANLDSLLTLDWDGVDVAEFTLTGAGKQALRGPAKPEWFTGFTDYCRGEFKQRYGFDPVDLFDRRSPHYWQNDSAGLETFYKYRIDVNVSTQHRLFSELDRIQRTQEKSWELMLTIADNSSHPEFDYLLGFDTKETVDLLKEFNVTLQVEDPYMEWAKPPDRYVPIVNYYRRLLEDLPFVIDVNVVRMKRERWRDFSTSQPIGAEVFQCWKFAAGQNGRACFYCESSVSAGDWELMPYVMAADAHASPDSMGWLINAPFTVMLNTISSDSGYLLDGQRWIAYGATGVIIPAGNHHVRPTISKESPGGVRLVSINCELLSARTSGTQCIVEYSSRQRCALGFSRRLFRVAVDGTWTTTPILMQGEMSTIIVPNGRHSVVVSVE